MRILSAQSMKTIAFICGLTLATSAFASETSTEKPSTAPGAAAGPSCILAGRLGESGRWAPRTPGVSLHDAQGAAVSAATRDALAQVRQLRLSRSATLTTCDGDGASLAAGPDMADGRGPVPIVTAGSGFIPVLAVHHPRSRLGQWVELQVQVPPERLGVAAR